MISTPGQGGPQLTLGVRMGFLTRGPHVMDGYFRNREATDLVLQSDRWLRTGELGKLDGDGFPHIVGRSKELIIRGGFNVYPPEVEAAFNNHLDVIQCTVIGRTVAGEEEVLAFVQCADPDGSDLAALRTFVAGRLTAYKHATRIVVATTLPAAPSGKILKHKLVSVFADRLT